MFGKRVGQITNQGEILQRQGDPDLPLDFANGRLDGTLVRLELATRSDDLSVAELALSPQGVAAGAFAHLCRVPGDRTLLFYWVIQQVWAAYAASL